MNEYFLTAAFSALTGIAGWLTGRRKNLAETHLSELDAVEKAAGIWRELSENMQVKYDALMKKYDALLSRQQEIETELEQLRSVNNSLRKENKKLIERLNSLSSRKKTE